MKICTKCKIGKSLSEFYKDKYQKSGLKPDCKECIKKYYLKNSTIIKERHYKYRKNNPEITIYNNLKQRCNDIKNSHYKNYGGRGIKCLITKEEIKALWLRDEAWKLKTPSIDRIDNDGNYQYSNCQFIENSINSGKNKLKSILQYDLDGNFIKEWNSLKEANKILNIPISTISACLLGYRSRGREFIWIYKDINNVNY